MEDKLRSKIKVLSETIWEKKADGTDVDLWLNHFEKNLIDGRSEKLHALFLLSKVIFFGESQIKAMLRALYRDIFKYPLVYEIRKNNGDTRDQQVIEDKFKVELEATRFLGLGNPSESGTFLLYPFRQENCLNRNLFIYSHEILTRNGVGIKIRNESIKHYVFIDDLCSSGNQALSYSEDIVKDLKRLKPEVDVQYLALVGREKGLRIVKEKTKFDKVEAVFILDDSFKCFGPKSRYFINISSELEKNFAEKMARKYGEKLKPGKPREILGFRNNQLLLGFHHNIPDNTLPIICCDGTDTFKWHPVLKRIEKRY